MLAVSRLNCQLHQIINLVMSIDAVSNSQVHADNIPKYFIFSIQVNADLMVEKTGV